MLPSSEYPMDFLASLPPGKRALLWLPRVCVTLTLPDHEGTHTAFTVRHAPITKELAFNVATYTQRTRYHGAASATLLP